MGARALDCELQVKGIWSVIGIDQALKLASSRSFRCTECHGAVRVHKEGLDGTRAHFEHHRRFEGCSRSMAFDGQSRANPRAIT